ncbi:MAG TPA: heme lyase CcmF/NrfE family subunit [Desulfobacterales bacterium]|nr:heme lyase CcmF/NrfE family subunit [Desulfobacterales bacterium]
MPEIGYYSVLTAFFLSGYSALVAFFGIRGRKGNLVASAENAAYAVFGFLTIASFVLIYALVTRDFQIEYVARYTSNGLPMTYTIAAFYAGQKGSLLLWGWLLSIFAAIVTFQNRKKNRELLPYVLAVLMTVTLFFTFLMVFVTNPFETLNYRPPDGQGLNPLLQNPGMLFHPPTLFIGYVGLTVPFGFAIAALITGQLDAVWIKTTRKWTIVSWFFLTAGNILGMEWAYVELGWGGYWAWDPVENASFMPWIVATAYLHSVMIQEKRGMLKVWNIVLIIFSFLMTLFGTFITRSGLIASVHSFGESSLGWIFLIFLIASLVISLTLLILRLPQLKSKNSLDSFLSKESSFLYNNLLLVGIAFTVLWGTLFPIISEAIRGVKITVGPPFFNAVITPIGLGLLFLMGICPLIAWRKSSVSNLFKKFFIPSTTAAVGAVVLFIFGIRSFYTLISYALCIFVLITLFLEFFYGTRTRHSIFKEGYHKALWNLVVRNKRRYGGYVVHFGVVLVFIALSANTFNLEKQITLKKGESFNFEEYKIRYDSLVDYPTATKQVVAATLSLFNNGHKVAVLVPEKTLFKSQEQPTTEVAIHTTLKEDLYVILAGYGEDWITLKVLINPLVVWLWIGGVVMGLGTLIVMLPDRRRQSKSVRKSIVRF